MLRFAIPLVLIVACGGKSPTSPPAPKPPVAVIEAEPEPELPDAESNKALSDKACPRVTAPFYYRIEKAGKVSHVLGSRHMGVSLAKMPASVTDELKKASLVVFETAPGDDAGSDTPPGPALSELLGAALWQKYKALVGTGMATMLENTSPAVAMVAMMMVYENQEALLDTEIERLVTDARIATAGLESSAFQDKLLNELLDLRMLKAAITGTPNRAALRREAVEDITEYCAGTDETPGMDGRTRAMMLAGGYTEAELATMDDKLLDQRNRAWMPKLEQMLGKGNVFVVVGADHLTGPRGVIAMLGQRGFTTARIGR